MAVMLKRLLASSAIILAAWYCAPGQSASRPLSPPERPPVPLTDADQERARAADSSKQKEQSVSRPEPARISIPGRHISSGHPVIDGIVYEAAARHRLDPCLIFSVMSAESAYNRLAVSPKGACGLMQLIPATASRFGVRNIFDPRENVMGGAGYLRWLLDRFNGDVRLALAGYNAGEGAVEFYGYRIPPFLETQNYVRTIYARYSRIHDNSSSPVTIARDPAIAPVPAKTDTSKEIIPTYNQIIRFTSSTEDNAKR